MTEYIHLPESEDIGPEGRSYQIKEEVLDYKGRKVFYVKAEAGGGITFCDGSCIQALNSFFVKGYITEWKTKNEKVEFVSKLEAIGDPREQQEIKEILGAKYGTSSIYFNLASDN